MSQVFKRLNLSMKRAFWLLLMIAVGSSSCYFDKEETLYPSISNCDSTQFTYNATIAPMLQTRCGNAACHGAGSPFGDFSTYNGLMAKVNNGSFKSRVIDQKNMPPMGSPTLSACDYSKISKWLNAGAPNN